MIWLGLRRSTPSLGLHTLPRPGPLGRRALARDVANLVICAPPQVWGRGRQPRRIGLSVFNGLIGTRVMAAIVAFLACSPAPAQTMIASAYGGGRGEHLSRYTATGEAFIRCGAGL